MPASFLLRFEVTAGTQPTDPQPRELDAETGPGRPDGSQSVSLAATKTITEVKREQADADPSSWSYRMLPR